MLEAKKIACIIPARLKSSRFSQKILTFLLDKPLLQWIFEAAQTTRRFSEIIFAIDSEEVASIIKSFGGIFQMTSSKHKSGTDRLIEIMKSGKVAADIWVNWQGDEPFITPKMITQLLQTCDSGNADIWTLKHQISKQKEILSPNVVKVVCDQNNNALYFSRSPIPFYKNPNKKVVYFKHVGIYAFTTKALWQIATLPASYLEAAECLEQLRFLYHNLAIQVHETKSKVIGINTKEDLLFAEKFAKNLQAKGKTI